MASLAAALPRESAVMRAELGEAADWSRSDHLLAALIELVDVSSWRAVAPHVKKGWRPPKPVQVPRPGSTQRRTKRNATSADLARIFGAAGRYVPGGDN
jgi:hypothetical protein